MGRLREEAKVFEVYLRFISFGKRGVEFALDPDMGNDWRGGCFAGRAGGYGYGRTFLYKGHEKKLNYEAGGNLLQGCMEQKIRADSKKLYRFL